MIAPDGIDPKLSRGKARQTVARLFRDAGIGTSDLDARVLVCAACGIDHLALTRDPDTLLGAAAGLLANYAARRLAREPVARILARREFWGLTFAISPDVLDPRPETEGLVGAVLDAVGGRRPTPLALLDLGTGSGAILAALLRELPGAFGVGLDRSAAACVVAKANLERLGLSQRGHIVCGTWADPLGARFDVVVSNPPYVRQADIALLPEDVQGYDPIAALDGGADGLDAYRAIAADLDMILCPGGIAAFECGFDQGAWLAELLRRAGLVDVLTYRDLAGHPRVVLGTASSVIPKAARHVTRRHQGSPK